MRLVVLGHARHKRSMNTRRVMVDTRWQIKLAYCLSLRLICATINAKKNDRGDAGDNREDQWTKPII